MLRNLKNFFFGLTRVWHKSYPDKVSPVFFESILSSINSLLISVDKDFKICLWNEYAESLFDIRAQDVLDCPLNDLDIGWDIEKLLPYIKKVFKDHSAYPLPDIRLNNKKMTLLLGITLKPVFNNGNFQGVLILGKDVKEKRLNELRQLNDQKMKSIGELSAGIVHEINTPVQYLYHNITFAEDYTNSLKQFHLQLKNILSEESNQNDANALQALKDIFQKSDLEYYLNEMPQVLQESADGLNHIRSIIKSIQTFVHPDQQKPERISLNQAIFDVMNISRNVWKYDSEIETNFSENEIFLEAFAIKLRQVFLNLIVNASHSISDAIKKGLIKKGKIYIDAQEFEHDVIVKIKDNGIGIKSEIVERIFEPFFTTKETGVGTGQGLALSKDIVEKFHHGEISCESEEAKGATFIIKLPKNPIRESRN